MKVGSGGKAVVGLVLLCACLSFVAVQALPLVAPVTAAVIPGTASPTGDFHSGGTAWAHDPLGGGPGVPEAD